MGFPLMLARPSVANASGGGQASQEAVAFGVPVTVDEAGNAIAASQKFAAVAVALVDPATGTFSGGGGSYAHITTNTTTTVKSGAGTLQNIVINNPGSAWVATVYDNTAGSGTVIAVISAAAGQTLPYNLRFSAGLTIVTTGTTPGDMTVIYD